MLPLPVKYLGAGKAEAFYQSSGIPLFGTSLRLSEIPVALPNPFNLEWATNEQGTVVSPLGTRTFPNGFPATGYVGGQTGAPVTGVRHYTFAVNQYVDPGVVPIGGTTLWGYKPALTLLEGLTALHAIPNAAGAPLSATSVALGTQPQRHLGGIMLVESYQPVQLTMVNNLELDSIVPNDLTIPGTELGVDRTAVHFHGGLVPWISDGGPFDWFCSTRRTVKACGSSFINNKVLQPFSVDPDAPYNSKTQGEYYWPNQQSSRFGWFHDHAFGITRTNAYSGVATGQIFRDNFERNLVTLGLPPLLEDSLLNLLGVTAKAPLNWAPVREYPLVLQDKIFISKTNIRGTLDPSWPSTCPQSVGSLWYPHIYERARWARAAATNALPTQSCIAEMFGDTILVNGTAFPTLAVEPRRYRFRVLNAQNARFANLQLYYSNTTDALATTEIRAGGIIMNKATGVVNTIKCPPFNDGTVTNEINPATGSAYGAGWITQIGCETGLLPTAIAVNVKTQITPQSVANNANLFNQTDFSLLVGCAERPDIIVDFSLSAGKTVVLYGDAPAPFPGGDAKNDYFPGLIAFGNTVNAKTAAAFGPNSRINMRFVVGNNVTGAADLSNSIKPGMIMTAITVPDAPWNSEGLLTVPDPASGPGYVKPDPALTINKTVRVGLFEGFDKYGRLEQFVGPATGNGVIYDDSALSTEEIHDQGSVEIWEVYNTTADVHPMHWHLFNAQILDRRPFTANSAPPLIPDTLPTGSIRPPLADEYGFKETIKCWPGECVRFIVKVGVPQIKKADGTVVLCPTSPRGSSEAVPNDVYNTNEYVWHCHILEHEEHDMMRPLCVPAIGGTNSEQFAPTLATIVDPISGHIERNAPTQVTLTGSHLIGQLTFNKGTFTVVSYSSTQIVVIVTATAPVGTGTFTVTTNVAPPATATIEVVVA